MSDTAVCIIYYAHAVISCVTRATTSPAHRWLTQHTRKFTPGRIIYSSESSQLCVARKFLIRQADRSANGGERCLSAFRFGPAKIQSGTSIGTKSRKKIMKNLYIPYGFLSSTFSPYLWVPLTIHVHISGCIVYRIGSP